MDAVTLGMAKADTRKRIGGTLQSAHADALGVSNSLDSIARGMVHAINSDAIPALDSTFLVRAQSTKLYLPSTFSWTKPVTLVMYWQGVGSVTPIPSEVMLPLRDAALAKGFAFVSCAYRGPHYGSPNHMDDVRGVLESVLITIPVSGIVCMGGSMGTAGLLNAIARNVLPNVLGAYIVQPVVSLKQRYDNGRASEIIGSYGLAGDGSDYATKTAGYDPALRPGSDFRGIPFYISASPSDTQVPKVDHADKLVAALQGYSTVTVKNATGNHGDASHFIAADFSAWLDTIVRKPVAPDPLPAPENTTLGQALPISTGLLADFVANDLTIANDITSWAPTRGTETVAATNASGASRCPDVVASSFLGGKKSVKFTKADNQYLRTAAWASTQNIPLTIYTVHVKGADAVGTVYSGRASSNYAFLSATSGLPDRHSSNAGAATGNLTTGPSTNAGSVPYVTCQVLNGADSSIRVNTLDEGAIGATGTSSAAGLTGVTLANNTGLSAAMEGELFRFVVFAGAHSSTDARRCMQSLGAQYGVTIN